MTLQQLFDLSTIEHRHLLIAYLLVALVQLAFLVATLRGLRRSAAAPSPLPPRPGPSLGPPPNHTGHQFRRPSA